MRNSVVIIGGGPTGLTAGALLANSDLSVNIIEAKPEQLKSKDTKALALSNSSVFVLKKLNIWDSLLKKAIAINEIHVSQKNTFGRTLFKSEDYEEDALGYIVSYSDLINSLRKKIRDLKNTHLHFNTQAKSIEYSESSQKILISNDGIKEKLSFDLLVLADGGQSSIEGLKLARSEKDEGHIALVSSVKTNKPHKGRAYERFTKSGPIALLPNSNERFTLVWTGPKNIISKIETLDDYSILNELQENFGNRAGSFIDIKGRTIFPLKSSMLQDIIGQNVIAIGNASQIIHPVAGQGLNIGIREALELSKNAKIISDKYYSEDISTELSKMLKSKSSDIIKITDQLSSFFLNDIVGLNSLRGFSLSILDAFPSLKKKFVKKMSYGE